MNVIKVNVDVAVRKNFAVVAAILRDDKSTLRGFKLARINTNEPLVGEAEGPKWGSTLLNKKVFS